jgi:plasmid stabilization system protein ParE
MAEPRIVLSARAEKDLADIETYVVAQDGPLRADLVMTRIEATFRTLAYNPAIGRHRPEISRRDALFFPSSPWMIMYRPLRDLSGIRIMRIVHGRRDLSRAIRD